MRYWVYKDSQILGPLAKEDLGLAGGVRPETLVCAEDSAGRMDADWRCAEEVGELSGLCATAPAPAGQGGFAEPDPSLPERLHRESPDFPGEGADESWLTDLFSTTPRLSAADLPPSETATPQELKDSQTRVQQLVTQIELLSRSMSELEAEPRQELEDSQALVKELVSQIERLNRGLTELEAPPGQEPASPPPAAASPPAAAPPITIITAVPPAAPAPLPQTEAADQAPVPEVPPLPPEQTPYSWETPPVSGGGLPQAGVAPLSAQEPLIPAAMPEIPAAPKARPRRVVKVSAPTSLRKVEKHSPPAADQAPAPATLPPPAAPPVIELSAPPPTSAPESFMPNMMTTAFPPAVPPEETGVVAPPAVPPPGMSTAPAPYQWGTQPVPGGGLPQAGSVPPSMMTGAFPSVTAPQDAGAAPPPPETMMEAAPGSAPAPSAPAPTAPLPMTMAFSRSGAAIAPAAFPSTQEVLAKLSKPEPPKSEPPKAVKVRSKTPLIIIGAASAVVIAAAWFFLFRNAKDLKTAVRMDSGRPPVGSEMPEESAAGAKPRAAAAAPAPQAAQPAQLAQPVQPAKGGATAPAPAAQPPAADIRDERPAAITLVKEFPLDGERGSIAKWLQYSFAATPGTQNDEKWDAGAYEENTYAVKYMVQPAGKEPITYLFEADLANQMVKGMNAAAKDLLAGRSPAKAKAKAKARKAKKRAPRRRASPAPAKPAAVLPLPSDAELAPPAQPAQDDSAFRSDTVQPNF